MAEITNANNNETKITCKLIKHICVLGEHESGWRKELNVVSWNGGDARYDIRSWSPDHRHKGKGVTLSADEAELLASYILSDSSIAATA